MAVILPGILIFPFTYDLSLRMLKEQMISSTNFVAASACPYYALIIYVCKHRLMKQDNRSDFMISTEEEEFARRVLQAEELFSYQENSLNWQTIQFYRTIVMNLTTIMITNPMHRYIWRWYQSCFLSAFTIGTGNHTKMLSSINSKPCRLDVYCWFYFATWWRQFHLLPMSQWLKV